MNYNKLKNIIEKQNYSIAKACREIGRTDAWFHKAIRHESMTIRDLEKILALCKSSMAEFFCNEKSVPTLQEPQKEYGTAWRELAEARAEIIKLKDENASLKECCKQAEEKEKVKSQV
jgi:hypothetical protein